MGDVYDYDNPLYLWWGTKTPSVEHHKDTWSDLITKAKHDVELINNKQDVLKLLDQAHGLIEVLQQEITDWEHNQLLSTEIMSLGVDQEELLDTNPLPQQPQFGALWVCKDNNEYYRFNGDRWIREADFVNDMIAGLYTEQQKTLKSALDGVQYKKKGDFV